MTMISKILLTGAVAVAAIAISSAPSEAAKKKGKQAAACIPFAMCSVGPAAGVNRNNVCGAEGKWRASVITPTCVMPFCPPKCG